MYTLRQNEPPPPNTCVLNANRGGPSQYSPKPNHSHVTPNPDRVQRARDSSHMYEPYPPPPMCNVKPLQSYVNVDTVGTVHV